MGEKFTLDNGILLDALNTVSRCREQSEYKPIVYGGIAVQLYAQPHYPELLRPTHDVDMLLDRKISSEQFRQGIAVPLSSGLTSYDPQTSVLRHVYEVSLRDDEASMLLLHLYKWSEKGYEHAKKTLERQVADAVEAPIPGSDQKLRITRPEDIVASKLRRLSMMGRDNSRPDYMQRFIIEPVTNGYFELLEEDFLSQDIGNVVSMKKNLGANYDRGEEQFRKALNEYVEEKDLFDISLLTRMVLQGKLDFDMPYFRNLVENKE